MHYARGVLELAHGRDADALAAFQAAERLGGRLTAPHMLLTPTRALVLHTLVRLGDAERAEQALADLGECDRDRGEMRIAAAVLRLAEHDPRAAMATLAPVLDGSAPVVWSAWLVEAFLLEAIARDALGDPAPPARPWSARSTWPNQTACCCGSWCTRPRACWRATPGTAPPTPPRSPTSSACLPG